MSERFKPHSTARKSLSDVKSVLNMATGLASIAVFLGILFMTMEMWSPVYLLVAALFAFHTLLTVNKSRPNDRGRGAVLHARADTRSKHGNG